MQHWPIQGPASAVQWAVDRVGGKQREEIGHRAGHESGQVAGRCAHPLPVAGSALPTHVAREARVNGRLGAAAALAAEEALERLRGGKAQAQAQSTPAHTEAGVSVFRRMWNCDKNMY